MLIYSTILITEDIGSFGNTVILRILVMIILKAYRRGCPVILNAGSVDLNQF